MPATDDPGQGAVPVDYDSDPGRFAANQAATARFSVPGDVHRPVADRLSQTADGPVLDLGGGNGILDSLLARLNVPTIVLDSATYVHEAPRPAVRGDARRLPFADRTFGAAAALWMLYHVPYPRIALLEAARALRPGGTFVASTPSRYNDPEIARALPSWGDPFSFDAESAPDLLETVFEVHEIEDWDERTMTLPDEAAVKLFLRGRGLSESRAEQLAGDFATPLVISKRGALIWATRRQ